MKMNSNLYKLTRIFPEEDRKKFLRLDMNENPEGLPVEFVESVLKKVTPEFLAQYPEAGILMKQLAEYHNLSIGNFCITDGSEMAIKHIFEVFDTEGSNVVTVNPSFAMYSVFADMYGLENRKVDINDDFSFPFTEYLSMIDKNTSLVILVSPNNPVGGVLQLGDVEKIIKKAVSVDAMVIIDEAYHYFCDLSCIDFIKKYPNVIVLRTFSKLLSLASCRIGYAISTPENCEHINLVRPSFEANAIGILFASELLKYPDIIKRLIDIEKDGRQYLLNYLEKKKYSYYYGDGNFVLIKTNISPAKVSEAMRENKILIKTYSSSNLLQDYVRVSTGSYNSMRQFTEVLEKIDCR